MRAAAAQAEQARLAQLAAQQAQAEQARLARIAEQEAREQQTRLAAQQRPKKCVRKQYGKKTQRKPAYRSRARLST